MLKDNGALFISDNNNIRCKYRDTIYQFWNRLEYGPVGPIEGFHTGIEYVYSDLRENYIRERFSDELEENEIITLKDRTIYLYGDQIKEACETILSQESILKINIMLKKLMHPNIHGYLMEKLFDPILKNKLLTIGFKKITLLGLVGI